MTDQDYVPHMEPEAIDEFVEYLNQNAVGRENAKTASTIIEALGIDTSGGSTRPKGTRGISALANGAVMLGHPVCADRAGFFIPVSIEEADSTLNRLFGAAETMRRRAMKLSHVVEKRFSV